MFYVNCDWIIKGHIKGQPLTLLYDIMTCIGQYTVFIFYLINNEIISPLATTGEDCTYHQPWFATTIIMLHELDKKFHIKHTGIQSVHFNIHALLYTNYYSQRLYFVINPR